MTLPRPRHLSLIGPTASGKSSVAMLLAEKLIATGQPCELISVDSMQVYRGMEIGTAAPTLEDQQRVPHHMVSIRDPHLEYSVAEFAVAVRGLLDQFAATGTTAILVGGTALYWQTVVDELELPGQFPETAAALDAQSTEELYTELQRLDPTAAAKMEPTNRRRILRALEVTVGSGQPFSSYGPGLVEYPPTTFALAGIHVPRRFLQSRIASRFEQQLTAGFVEEVQQLMELDPPWSRTASRAIGYPELQAYLQGELSRDDAVTLAVQHIRQFSVRQERWFRRDPRITWFERYFTAADNHLELGDQSAEDATEKSDEDLAAEIFSWWMGAQ